MYIESAMQSFEYGITAFGIGFGTEGIFCSLKYLIKNIFSTNSKELKKNTEDTQTDYDK